MNALILKKSNFKEVEAHNAWISQDSLRLQRQLKRLKKKQKSTNSLCTAQKIADIALQLKTLVKTDKQQYFGELLPNFISTSPEKFW